MTGRTASQSIVCRPLVFLCHLQISFAVQWHQQIENSLISCQAGTLHTTYHISRILVHRPLMMHSVATSHSGTRSTLQNESPSNNLRSVNPALTICADSARSCALTIEHQLRHGFNHVYVPNLIEISYVSAATLILIAWNLKVDEKGSLKRDLKPPIVPSMTQTMTDIKFFVRTLEDLKDRWSVVDSLLSVNSFNPQYSQKARTDDLEQTRTIRIFT